MTIGDWTARVWVEDLKTPIMMTKYHPSYVEKISCIVQCSENMNVEYSFHLVLIFSVVNIYNSFGFFHTKI